MKLNELCIGNHINLMLNHEDSKVLKVALSDLISIEKNQGWYQPIPLTEEWLFKLGFELINNDFYRSRNSELELHWTVNKNKMIPEYNGKRLITGYNFKYVHQLQNLYFALTGEELTFKSE